MRIALASVAALGLLAGTALAEEAGDAEGAAAQSEEATAPEPQVKVSGAVRFTYRVLSWEDEDSNRERLGDIIYDTFQLGADGSYGPLVVSGSYRFYQGYNMLHHGYLGYKVSENAQIDFGLSQAPFGILPFASHNWFFNVPYYMGMEDDYDVGVRGTFELGDFDVRAAVYKNSEGSYTGSSRDSARYSYDVVEASAGELGYAGADADILNQETNQLNLRVAYNLQHGSMGSSELGISGRVGGLYNSSIGEYGYHWAGAAHVNSNYGPFNLHLQGIAYRFAPNNPPGQTEDVVVMGAYDAPYFVAAGGYLLTADLSYKIPLESDVISSLSVHENFSTLIKDAPDGADYESTRQNALGALVVMGPIYAYFDLVSGQHHPWLGPGVGYGRALVEGRYVTTADGEPSGVPAAGTEADDSWHNRVNVNIGYYF